MKPTVCSSHLFVVSRSATTLFTKTLLRKTFTKTLFGVAAFVVVFGTTNSFAQHQANSSSQEQKKTVSEQTVAALPQALHEVNSTQERTQAQSQDNTQSTFVPAKITNKYVLRSHLQYPPDALRQGKEGHVDVFVYLNADGTISSMNFSSDVQSAENEFAAAAFDAVKKCRFTPALRNNTPVSSVVKISVRFVL
jgi:TonB family protein